MKTLVAILTSEELFLPTNQLITSIRTFWNYWWDVLLFTSFMPKMQEEFYKARWVKIITFESIFSWFNHSYPNIILLKFYLFTEFFKKWDQVMYLDVDITIRCDLNSLFSRYKNWIYAVREFWFAPLSSQFRTPSTFNDLEFSKWKKIEKSIDLERWAYNTGVILFNTNIIHASTFPSLLKLYNDLGEISFFIDQVIINIFFYSQIKSLPLCYNNYISFYYECEPESFLDITHQYWILHFPWKNKLYNSKSPYFAYYSSILCSKNKINSYINQKILNLETYNIFLFSINQRIHKSNFILYRGKKIWKNTKNHVMYI